MVHLLSSPGVFHPINLTHSVARAAALLSAGEFSFGDIVTSTSLFASTIGREKYYYGELNWTMTSPSLFTTTITEAPSSPHSSAGGGGPSGGFPGKNVIIPLYTLIFILSMIGNLLVIVTLIRNRRMRTVTNVFLLNLAISDLLLGVFCVPVTIVGQILRNFIFGHFMCKIIPYFQALSISVSAWTLTAISCERFFAICRPLQSRKWQTRSHAYKIIAVIWVTTLTWNIPIAFVSQLQPIRNTGRYKCREMWPNPESEKIFNLVLDFLLLLIPLCIMAIAYSLIVSKLWKGLQSEILHTRSFHEPALKTSTAVCQTEQSLDLSSHSHYSLCRVSTAGNGNSECTSVRIASTRDGIPNEVMTFRSKKGIVVRWKRKTTIDGTSETELSSVRNGVTAKNGSSDHHHHHHHSNLVQQQPAYSRPTTTNTVPSNRQVITQINPMPKFSRAIRSTYTGKSIESKKKVIRMLFVLVLEFFLAWTPLYVMNTWYLFNPEAVYHRIGPLGISTIQLLAYTSSCTNPITYCFMNRKEGVYSQFRQAFIKVFQCGYPSRPIPGQPTLGRGSDLSGNDSLIYGVPGSTINKSEVVVLDCEDRV